MISPAHLHVRPMGCTCRWAGEIEPTPIGVMLNGSRRVHLRGAAVRVAARACHQAPVQQRHEGQSFRFCLAPRTCVPSVRTAGRNVHTTKEAGGADNVGQRRGVVWCVVPVVVFRGGIPPCGCASGSSSYVTSDTVLPRSDVSALTTTAAFAFVFASFFTRPPTARSA